jgi:hypothetical protein
MATDWPTIRSATFLTNDPKSVPKNLRSQELRTHSKLKIVELVKSTGNGFVPRAEVEYPYATFRFPFGTSVVVFECARDYDDTLEPYEDGGGRRHCWCEMST